MKIPKIEYECDLPDFFLFADWFFGRWWSTFGHRKKGIQQNNKK